MALVRALIRRRLGRVPGHSHALADYELDFLATHITFCPEFRNFHQVSKKNKQYLQGRSPEFAYRWKVKTSKPRHITPFLFRLPKGITASPVSKRAEQEIKMLSKSPSAKKKSGFTVTIFERKTADSGKTAAPYFEPASCQQLLRVRERLGDLCKWDTNSSESSLALVKSIELFLNTFLSQTSGPKIDTLPWVIQTLKPVSAENSVTAQEDTVTIPIRRSAETGKWEVELGQLDAAVSLWMASIEASLSNARKEASSAPPKDKRRQDWRRAESGKGMIYKFCRILGDDFEDCVLKRDLSWWVDDLLADQSALAVEKEASTDGWHRSRARDEDVDLVIGFNGRPKEGIFVLSPSDLRGTANRWILQRTPDGHLVAGSTSWRLSRPAISLSF